MLDDYATVFSERSLAVAEGMRGLNKKKDVGAWVWIGIINVTKKRKRVAEVQ